MNLFHGNYRYGSKRILQWCKERKPQTWSQYDPKVFATSSSLTMWKLKHWLYKMLKRGEYLRIGYQFSLTQDIMWEPSILKYPSNPLTPKTTYPSNPVVLILPSGRKKHQNEKKKFLIISINLHFLLFSWMVETNSGSINGGDTKTLKSMCIVVSIGDFIKG